MKYLKYWFNEKDGTVFCLVDAPNKEAYSYELVVSGLKKSDKLKLERHRGTKNNKVS